MPKRGLPRSPHSGNSVKLPTEEGVAEPDVNDVISGRGDTINRHPGNVQFRQLVEEKRRVYLSSHFKREKRLIAETIVANIKAMDPPGRFLSRDPRTGLWFSIGEDRAREKASQALRENSKKIRAEIQQKDNQRKRENAPHKEGANSNVNGGRMDYSNPSNGKPGHFDPHHPFPPYPPHSSSGWGYPYYYGYGPHQVPVPPFPPPAAFHPHAYHPPPPHPSFGAGYPDAVPPFGSRQDFDQPRSRPSFKSDSSDDHNMDNSSGHMDSSSGHMDSCSGGSSDEAPREDPPRQREQEEQRQARHAHPTYSAKCRRIEPLKEHAAEQAANTDHPKEMSQLSSFYPPKEPQLQSRHHRPGYGHPPPVMPSFNGSNNSNHDEQTPHKLISHPFKASPPNRPVLPAHNQTPESTGHNLAPQASPPSCYTIKSPHTHNFGAAFRGPFLGAHHGHPGGATLTPAGATCMAALNEILGSPHHDEEGSSNASMGYTHSPGPNAAGMDACSPLQVASPGKDSAVPFSPIRAQLDAKGRPSLKPRPFYR